MEITPKSLSDPAGETWRGVDVLAMTIAIGAIFLTGFAVLNILTKSHQLVNPNNMQPTIILSVALGALEGVALIGGVYFLGLRRRNLPWAVIGLRPTPANWIYLAVILGIVAIPLSGLVATIVQLILDLPLENPQIQFLAPGDFSWFGAVTMLLLGGVLVPFAEELFFRGVLYQWIRKRWSIWIGIMASAFIFGAIHGDIPIAAAATVLGIILAWTYERSQSLWPAVIIHVINNSFKIFLLYAMLASGITLPL